MSQIEDKNDQYKNMFMFQTGMTQKQYIQQLSMKQYLATYIAINSTYEVDLPIEAENLNQALELANLLTESLKSEPFMLVGIREEIES